jgi:hypothetical protein
VKITRGPEDEILRKAVEEAIRQHMTPDEAARLYSETIPDNVARNLSQRWGGVDDAKAVRDAGERIKNG